MLQLLYLKFTLIKLTTKYHKSMVPLKEQMCTYRPYLSEGLVDLPPSDDHANRFLAPLYSPVCTLSLTFFSFSSDLKTACALCVLCLGLPLAGF